MSDKLYNVGIYIRLSVDGTLYGSESIENQREMLTKFIAHMPGWIEKRIYIDNGASGGNFNRKGFQDMMTDVRSREINLVLVQDLSRFGRNYLEAGKYLEDELPSLGCRFVSLMDGIDTETGENDIMPLLNAMHDLHLKSLSDRVTSVLHAKARAGHKLGRAPYGYKKISGDPTKLVIDDYASEVVRRIYDMRRRGVGYASIVKALNGEGIVPPLLYYYRQNGMDESKVRGKQMWLGTAVKSILQSEVYIGNAVQLVNRNVTYRERRQIKRSPDEWARVENAFPAIVERDIWEAVQEINRVAALPSVNQREPRKSLFSGVLVCADCGRTMVYKPAYYTDMNGQKKEYPNYMCRSYHNSGWTSCTRHTVSESKIKSLILSLICNISEQISLNEQSVLQLLQSRLIGERASTSVDAEKERKSLRHQLHRLEATTAQLYEDRVTGVVSEGAFAETVRKNETDRQQKSQRLVILEQSEQEVAAKLSDIHLWVSLIRENASIDDVSRDLLDMLIERIEVCDHKVENGVKTQDVRIIFKFVGNV